MNIIIKKRCDRPSEMDEQLYQRKRAHTKKEFLKKITRKIVESFARSCDRRPRTTERSVIGCYILNNRPRAL